VAHPLAGLPELEQFLLECPVLAPLQAEVRAQARRVSAMVGLDAMQQTRFSTAVSEIARNAVEHAGGGMVSFHLRQGNGAERQRLIARIRDAGPGIPDITEVLHGRAVRAGRPAMGISGSSRLVDRLYIESARGGGTLVHLEMELAQPVRVAAGRMPGLAREAGAPVQAKAPMEELEQQNRELLRIHQELRERQVDLERGDEMKNQFVVTLAHELRNPLSTLQMSLDLLRKHPEGMSAADVARRYDAMDRQTRQLSKLVTDLLDAGRVSQGKAALQTRPVEVNALATHAIEMAEGAVKEKDHVLSLELHPAPLWIEGDPSRLMQVICNLVNNSARYTPTNGRIAVRVRPQQESVLVEVEDNGMGIPAADLSNIFGLFVQSENARNMGGLGVGLSLVRRLVQDHGGTVQADSEGPGKGSRFTVTLPLVAAPVA
jgi:signal transduction histidine kinase